MFEHELICRHAASQPQSRFILPESKPHFAPDRLVDVESVRLEISVDLPAKEIKGSCTTSFRAVAPGVGKLTFDAVDLVVEHVLDVSGGELRFDKGPEKLHVFLRKALQAGEQSSIVVKYRVTEPRAGLYFIQPDKDYPNRPWQLWSQGQDTDNRYWIPCHDAPNEKAATEMIVTVEERLTAISNGKLMGVTEDKARKTRTFTWKQEIPHCAYLITLCVGEFVEIKDSWRSSKGEEIPVQYFTLPGRERETRLSFGKTPKMVDFFSKRIGVDFPYEKYAQVVAWDFIYGGMENTTATTQTEYTLHPESVELDYSSEPLVAHELAHQWFGDLLTCKEWSHAWLNEGFATYFESIWMEHEHGKDEFLYELFLNEKMYEDEDSGAYRRPIVTNVYLSPSDLFDRHLYEKGGRVLHMLRRLVGDELWWKAIQRYVAANRAGTVETVDLQRAFEETTGRSLSWFFEQWVHRAGHPELKATYEWIEDKKQARLSIRQAQGNGDSTRLFRLPLQFKLVTSDGEYVHELELTEAEQSWHFSCADKPKFVSLNPENTVLASLELNPGLEELSRQIQGDKDVMGRIFAAKELAKGHHSRAAVDALGAALANEKFWGAQAEIADALGEIGTERCQEQLLKRWSEIRHPRARTRAIEALGRFRDDRSIEALEKALKSDPSPSVQFAAGCALGRMRSGGVFEKLSAALGKRDSWHDHYDRGILMGLAELRNDERVLPILIRNTKPGLSIFVRRQAVEALARFGVPRPALVLDTLMEMTRDSNYFVRILAVRALAGLGDDRAVGALQRVADSVVEPRTHRAAVVGMKRLREGRSPQESVEKLRADFDRLREQYRALLSKVERLERT